MIGHDKVGKLVDHDISYELPVLLEKPVAELQFSPLGKALAPKRLVVTERDLLGHGDAALFEQGIHLVAKVDDKAPDAASSPLLVGHVLGAVVSGIGNFESNYAVFGMAGVFRGPDNLQSIGFTKHHEDLTVNILARKTLGLLFINDVVYGVEEIFLLGNNESNCLVGLGIIRQRAIQSTVSPYADVDVSDSFAFEFDADFPVTENQFAERHKVPLIGGLDQLIEVLAVNVIHCVTELGKAALDMFLLLGTLDLKRRCLNHVFF